MAMGAVFSAMEVIPLVLLTFEAWRFIDATERISLVIGYYKHCLPAQMGRDVPHRRGLLELSPVRGVRLPINLPIVSYYEIGTAFTANHAHGVLMGVYGMLAIGFFMFIADTSFHPTEVRRGR